MLLSATVAMDDLQDVRQSIKGDSEAYRRLIERYQQHVSQIMFRFARNKGAHQELVQDVFVEAYLSLSTYKAKAPFSHWLSRIATSVGYQFWKQNRRRQKTEHFSFEQWDSLADENNTESIEPDHAGRLLHQLLEQLPPRDRLVLTLRYLEQCDLEETARRTGWSKTMVKVQSYRAKKKLKKLFLQAGREIQL
jgi:RNA polymerase sigma-70 factor (ECF subfamily)